MGFNRDQVVEIARFTGCKNFVDVRERSLYSMCSLTLSYGSRKRGYDQGRCVRGG